ncbi:MAG: peptidyl-prolyl cis-trans isomerase [Alphaproteobacteria bacterium]|nr:peptidyl-prolyl cis-trans isomerase [Alphaproteobacteria bacterium]
MTDETKPEPQRRSVFAAVLSEPLTHFLLIGAVIFAGHLALHGDEEFRGSGVVVVSEGRINQIAEGYKLIAGRPPTPPELEGLVADFIDEEIAYQEAIALGLDADDTVVRRRMRQKLEYLAEDMEAISEPTEAELEDWLRTHPDRFSLSDRIAFEHVLASRDRRGGSMAADAADMLTKLKEGADPRQITDPSLLPQAIPPTSLDGVATLFGRPFANRLFAERADGWIGPLESAFGLHIIRITGRESARLPPLSDIRDQVRTDWIDTRRKDQREAYQNRVKDRYKVSIDWPEGFTPSSDDAGQ